MNFLLSLLVILVNYKNLYSVKAVPVFVATEGFKVRQSGLINTIKAKITQPAIRLRGRTSSVPVSAAYKKDIPINQIKIADWQVKKLAPMIKPSLLSKARNTDIKSLKSAEKAQKLIEMVEEQLSRFAALEEIYLKNSAILEILNNDAKFRYGYTRAKAKVFDKVHDSKKAMDQILAQDFMQKALVHGKKAVRIGAATEANRAALEKTFSLNSAESAAFEESKNQKTWWADVMNFFRNLPQ